MAKIRAMILVLAIAAVLIAAALPCPAGEKDKKEGQNVRTADDRRGPGPGPGPGPGERPEFGPGEKPPRGPGRERFELTDEEIDRIMDGLKQRDPQKAKELADLRKKDPEKFKAELGRHAHEEFAKLMEERMEKWRQQRRAEFLDWLEKNYRRETRDLANLKERDPNLYEKRLGSMREKYGPIRDAERRNPELAEVLKEDLRLKEREDELIGKIKATTNQNEKEKLTAELEEVVGDRYDLILRRKQIAYERLLKELEELQNRIKESHAEMLRYQDSKVKAENVKQRSKDLLEEKKGFRWD
jgi:hypothetical protein